MVKMHFRETFSEIRFLAPEEWRGLVKSARVRRRLQTFGGSLAPDPGPGPYMASVRLDRRHVERLAAEAHRDVAGFLRGLLALSLPVTNNWPAARPAEAVAASGAGRSAHGETIPAWCDICKATVWGTFRGRPPRFRCPAVH